jgi:hypothetical protein
MQSFTSRNDVITEAQPDETWRQGSSYSNTPGEKWRPELECKDGAQEIFGR